MLRPLIIATLVLVPTTASAGSFDGFAGGRYLTGGDRLCTPVTSERANPSCKKLGAAEVARLGPKKPRPERGSSARITARSRGTAIEVLDADGKAAFRWDAGTPVGRVLNVYVDKSASVAVVEYESRFGGRTVVEAIGVKLPGGGPTPSRPDPDVARPGPDADKPAGPDLDEAAQKKLESALDRAERSLKRRRYKAAIAGANAALGIWDQSARALYALAAAELGSKDRSAAIAALERLAGSKDPAAPEYRVEARLAREFAAIRGDARYRKAVGITADPSRLPTAYERLMGMGGKWEQRLIACEQPEVKLTLRRKLRRFVLRIKGRCGGPAETTFLDGHWSASGTDVLKLKFPNQSVGDELLSCQVERCRDSSGEDCVRCKIEQDEFLLRVVRR
jgi:hypothetical protein